eukprot:728846-Ditylum_brightwellii.AAC.1
MAENRDNEELSLMKEDYNERKGGNTYNMQVDGMITAIQQLFIDDSGDSNDEGNDKYSFVVVDDENDHDVPGDLTKSPTTNPTSYTMSQPAFGVNLDDDNVYNDDDNNNGISLLPDTKPP